jgi:two-component system, cell cycle sensor histidine kinase and response regulator CckA
MAVTFAVAAAVTFLLVRHVTTERAEENASAHATFIADSMLDNFVRPRDFSVPASGPRLAELDRLFGDDVLVQHVLRVKLWRRDGTVMYSNDHTLIGEKTDEPEEIEEAAGGTSVKGVSHLNAEGGAGADRKVLENYVPVRLGGRSRPVGVLELYQDYAPVAAEARAAFWPIAGAFGAVLLLLYASLFPIVRRMTLTLAARDRALRESDAKLRAVIEHVPLVTYMDAPDGTTEYISPQIETLLGYPVEQWLENRDFFTQILHPDDRDRVLTEVAHSRELGAPFQVEYRMLAKDGRAVSVLDGTVLVRDENDNPLYRHGFFLDLTAQKEAEKQTARLEEELRQSQKMEAIGQLAGGIAHDFNNLLMAIGGYSDVARSKLDGGDPAVANAIEEIKTAADRAAGLTRQLLAFSRKQILQPQVVDLNESVAGMDGMLRRLIGEDVDIVTELSPDTGRVRADPGQLEQVILNLVVNARDAMPDGGRLTIETAAVAVDGTEIGRESPLQPGSYAMLAVSDTGQGMDAETRKRIFDPFFTTKEPGKGTGLGLSTVYGIVNQSGGSLFVYSEPGHGTTFKVYLPQTGAVGGAASVEVDGRGGTETVLLVEDEAVVRRLVAQMLEAHGYRVLVAGDPDEAVSLSDSHEGRIDLLITDVVMPNMSGRELAVRLHADRPGMKILYISGYTDRAIVHHGVLAQGTVFLQKPFTGDDLARKVRAVLDDAPELRAAASA